VRWQPVASLVLVALAIGIALIGAAVVVVSDRRRAATVCPMTPPLPSKRRATPARIVAFVLLSLVVVLCVSYGLYAALK